MTPERVSRIRLSSRYSQTLTLIKQQVWYIVNKDNNVAEVFLNVFHQLDTQGTCFRGDGLQPHPNPSHYFMENLSIVVTDTSKTSLNNYAAEKFNGIMWATLLYQHYQTII